MELALHAILIQKAVFMNEENISKRILYCKLPGTWTGKWETDVRWLGFLSECCLIETYS